MVTETSAKEHMENEMPETVSLGVIAYNEADVVDHILSDIARQDYPHDCIEVILVDSASTDDTRKRLEQFAARCSELGFRRILVLDNPKRKQAAGWNVMICASREDIVIRIDAHASIPVDFVRKNVELHQQGEMITGGPRPNVIDQPTSWRETLLLAESSMFGSSIAPYRRQSGRQYVNSMFHAAYRREVFEQAGIFNEQLGRTEDNELHYRMREAGYRFCYDPEIVSYQHIRNSLHGMLKQKFGNGYWIGKTVKVCPACLSIYHFVPFAFLLGIAVTTILGCLHIVWPAMVMWGLYWLLALLMAVTGVIGRRRFYMSDVLLPGLFFLLHVTYGIGTFIGLCSKKPELTEPKV
jgi:glycosyltransferase involved in cell wall biosynthesis